MREIQKLASIEEAMRFAKGHVTLGGSVSTDVDGNIHIKATPYFGTAMTLVKDVSGVGYTAYIN